MILGVDPGERRIGLAAADSETRLARPLGVVDAGDDPIGTIVATCEEVGATLIVVGVPLTLSGQRGPAVRAQESFVASLRAAAPVPVVEHDERLTTVVAERALREAGASPRRRRELRDAVAASAMLQGFVDAHDG